MPHKFSNPSDVHLWWLNAADYKLQLTELTTLLSTEELARANKFHFFQHTERFIIAHAMLRKILSLYTSIAPEKIQFNIQQNAKPELANTKKIIQFNLSHTADEILIGVTPKHKIGVDIEIMRSNINLSIADRYFTVAEKEILQQAINTTEKNKIFFKIWTGKEAILKMTGEGIYGNLQSFSVNPKIKQQIIILNSTEKCHLTFIERETHLAAAVALSSEINEVQNLIYPT